MCPLCIRVWLFICLININVISLFPYTVLHTVASQISDIVGHLVFCMSAICVCPVFLWAPQCVGVG